MGRYFWEVTTEKWETDSVGTVLGKILIVSGCEDVSTVYPVTTYHWSFFNIVLRKKRKGKKKKIENSSSNINV